MCLLGWPLAACAQREFDGGKSSYRHVGSHYSLGNSSIEAGWDVVDERLVNFKVTNLLSPARTIAIESPLSLLLDDGRIIKMSDLHFVTHPELAQLTVNPEASRYSERIPGQKFSGVLSDNNGAFEIEWSLLLRDGSQYLRQVFTISPAHADLAIRDLRLIDLRLPDAHPVGSVRGSPIVDGNFFFAFEHPLSSSAAIGGRATSDLRRALAVPAGQSVTYSSVVGVAPAGQMRRAFLGYIERERAHPYRTFLHYNSWLDIGAFTPYGETEALDRINTFGQELHVKRSVVLDSFLFDDGWDNHSSLWSFSEGFPNGFSTVLEATKKYGAEPGVWLSPWGGYSKPKQERVQFGKDAGFEIVDGGFALSGPKYYERFREVCIEMIRKYGVNQFKFDGTGNADRVVPGSKFDSDFDAAIHLISDLRELKPDIYINLTTGTYASPFWLLYADSIWRGGGDTGLAGVGSDRERWITYRDSETFSGVVGKGPLFPLNSLMLHGIVYAKSERHLNSDPGNDFANEVRSYFGSGTQLQEMYITPSFLTKENWDTLAEAAKWSRQNADVLKDTHWIGGDPMWLNVYGWASWSPKKAILVLRNPSDHRQTISLDLKQVFEVPSEVSGVFSAKSPWKEDANKPFREMDMRTPQEIDLAPFQVLTLEMQPK